MFRDMYRLNMLCIKISLDTNLILCQHSLSRTLIYQRNQASEVIKLFLCATQLSMKFFLLMNVIMPTIVGILTLMSRKNSILGLPEPKKGQLSWYFYTYEQLKFHAQLS